MQSTDLSTLASIMKPIASATDATTTNTKNTTQARQAKKTAPLPLVLGSQRTGGANSFMQYTPGALQAPGGDGAPSGRPYTSYASSTWSGIFASGGGHNAIAMHAGASTDNLNEAGVNTDHLTYKPFNVTG